MTRRRLSAICAVLALWLGLGTVRSVAHDLPADVIVLAFLKPEGRTLHVLVRVPLRAMGDVTYATRGPGGLVDLAQVDRPLRDAVTLWILPALRLYENGMRLDTPVVRNARLSLPMDRSFLSHDEAAAHIAGPSVPEDTQIEWNQGLMDVALDFAIQSDRSRFAIDPLFARLGVRVVTALRFVSPGGAVRAFEFTGDPGLIPLDPSGLQAAWRFVQLGFVHILHGTDHLLFLVCLVIPVRRFRALVPVVTAFAVAHSITLIGSAFDLAPGGLWFAPLIETLIAVSIVYMAFENMLAGRFDHRWMVAFGFGLVHGFGFSFALRDSLQFAGSHLLTSLLSFNIGVELGQLLILPLAILPMRLLVRYAASERIATIVVSALVAHTAWHWMIDRGSTLSRFSFTRPAMDATFVADVLGWLLLVAIAGGAFWMLSALASWADGRKYEVQSTKYEVPEQS